MIIGIGIYDISFDENVAFLWLTAGISHQELRLFREDVHFLASDVNCCL